MKCSKVVNKSFGVGRPNTMGLASVLIFGMLSFPVVAESDDDDGAIIEEIIVTAQKRQENIQDVPISMASYSGDFLEAAGIDGLHDLTNYAANFRVDTHGTPRNSSIKIRGIGSYAQNAGIDSSVGVYLDDVYVPRIGAMLGNLVDIQSIEILRGPQGTLYGRNNPIGTLNLRTREPTQDTEAFLKATSGNYDRRQFSGYVSGGVGDDTAARLTFWVDDYEGYTWNTFRDSRVNDKKTQGVRIRTLTARSDRLEVSAIVDYQKSTYHCCSSEWYLLSPNALASFESVSAATGIPMEFFTAGTDDPYDNSVSNNDTQTVVDTQHGLAIVANYDLGDGHTLRSVTSYRKWFNDADLGFDETPASIVRGVQDEIQKSASQEFQLSSPDGGIALSGGRKLEYIGGFIYHWQDSVFKQSTVFLEDAQYLPLVVFLEGRTGIPGSNIIGPSSDDVWDQRANSKALFGQVTLHVSDDWSVTGGVRWTKDDKHAVRVSNYLNNFAPIARNFTNLSFDEEIDDSSAIWTFNTRYAATDDVMLYFTASSGYKAPGINARPIRASDPVPVTFGEENSQAFEIGAKTLLADGRLLLNLAAFRMTMEDMQQVAANPAGLGVHVRNAGELVQEGLELEAQARPTDWLDIRASAAFLNSEWYDFPSGTCAKIGGAPPSTDPMFPNSCDFNGLPADDSPDLKMSISAEMTFPLEKRPLEVIARAEYQYVDDFYHMPSLDSTSFQESYTLVNARVGLADINGRWQVTAWVKNLKDESYFSYIKETTAAGFTGTQGAYEAFPMPPRTFGFTVQGYF